MRVEVVGIETVSAEPMAALAARTGFPGLPAAITASLDKVYAVLRAGDFGPLGCNTVLYAPMPDGPPMDILSGVRLSQPFPGPIGEVVAAETPAGEAAHVVFFGDYAKMQVAHDAVRAAAREAGRQISGHSWEVYGDWSDDPEKLRTDIFYLLKARA